MTAVTPLDALSQFRRALTDPSGIGAFLGFEHTRRLQRTRSTPSTTSGAVVSPLAPVAQSAQAANNRPSFCATRLRRRSTRCVPTRSARRDLRHARPLHGRQSPSSPTSRRRSRGTGPLRHPAPRALTSWIASRRNSGGYCAGRPIRASLPWGPPQNQVQQPVATPGAAPRSTTRHRLVPGLQSPSQQRTKRAGGGQNPESRSVLNQSSDRVSHGHQQYPEDKSGHIKMLVRGLCP